MKENEVFGMPVYTYQCEECGVRFDARQKFSDDPIAVCPECDGPVHKVITPVGVVFKGSGFYVTDNRSGSRASLNSTSREKADDSGHNGTKSEEAKPESKSKTSNDT
jgi:putative FmdB family regulatory protein